MECLENLTCMAHTVSREGAREIAGLQLNVSKGADLDGTHTHWQKRGRARERLDDPVTLMRGLG